MQKKNNYVVVQHIMLALNPDLHSVRLFYCLFFLQVKVCVCVLKENKKLMNGRCSRSAECQHQALMSSGEVLFEAWHSLALPDTPLPSVHASRAKGSPAWHREDETRQSLCLRLRLPH